MAEFGLETWRDYQVSTQSESAGDSQSEIEEERLIKAKVGIPLYIKNGTILGAQLKYYEHRFDFDQEDQPLVDNLFQHLDTRKFTSAGIRFFYQKDMKTNQQLKLITGAELRSDVFQWNNNTSSYFISGMYTWKQSSTSEIGAGLVLNRNMGLTAVYPLFVYNKDLSPRWALNLTLPKSAALRYNWNERNFLIATTALNGWRYNISQGMDTTEPMTLRRVDLQLSLSWEHELHDWLWFGVDVGYSKNLQYFLTNTGDRRSEALIDLNSQDALYSKISIFIVPPRKFFR